LRAQLVVEVTEVLLLYHNSLSNSLWDSAEGSAISLSTGTDAKKGVLLLTQCWKSTLIQSKTLF